MKDSSFLENFTWDIVLWKLFRYIFLLRYLIKCCEFFRISNCPNWVITLFFALCVTLITARLKSSKYMETTIIDVKFYEEFKAKLRIELPCKENRRVAKMYHTTKENSETSRKSKYNLFRKIHDTLQVFLTQNTNNFLRLCQVWANLKNLFLRNEFFNKNTYFRFFFDIEADSAGWI